jgi:hypothetical protein
MFRISTTKSDAKPSDLLSVEFPSLEVVVYLTPERNSRIRSKQAALAPKWDSLQDRFGPVSKVFIAALLLQVTIVHCSSICMLLEFYAF